MREEDFQDIMRIQQLMSQRLMQEQKTDRKIDLYGVIQELTENGRKRIQVEAVLIEASMSNIPEDEAVNLMDDLARDSLIRRSRDGFVELS